MEIKAKQVVFRTNSDTIESKRLNCGIALYDKYTEDLRCVICGCCGGIFEPKDITSIRNLEWVPLEDEIMGE